MATECKCPGAICTCGVEGTVKDGRGVRVDGLMMDGAPGGKTEEVWSDEVFKAAGVPVKDGYGPIMDNVPALADADPEAMTEEEAAASWDRVIERSRQLHSMPGKKQAGR